MADARANGDEHAHGRLRAGGAAGRRGDDHQRAVSVRSVRLYTAPGCSLCERALEVVREAEEEGAFELEVVDIEGDPTLEAAYRELIPVVEIDGERAFTYFVEPEAFRARLAAAP